MHLKRVMFFFAFLLIIGFPVFTGNLEDFAAAVEARDIEKCLAFAAENVVDKWSEELISKERLESIFRNIFTHQSELKIDFNPYYSIVSFYWDTSTVSWCAFRFAYIDIPEGIFYVMVWNDIGGGGV